MNTTIIGENMFQTHSRGFCKSCSGRETGVNINAAQEVLWHTDIATTKFYTHVMEQFMPDQMDKSGG